MIELDQLLQRYKVEGLPEEKFRKLADLAERAKRLRELEQFVQIKHNTWLEKLEGCEQYPSRYSYDQCESWAQELAIARRELKVLRGAR